MRPRARARHAARRQYHGLTRVGVGREKHVYFAYPRTTLFPRFSVMHGGISGPADETQAKVLNALHERYHMKEYGRGNAQQVSAMTPEFIDRFAVVGDPARCRERLDELQTLDLDKLVVNGPMFTACSPEASEAAEWFESKVLPAFA